MTDYSTGTYNLAIVNNFMRTGDLTLSSKLQEKL